MCVGSIANAMDPGELEAHADQNEKHQHVMKQQRFNRYLPTLMPLIIKKMSVHDEPRVCQVAVGTVGDISRCVGQLIVPYTDAVIKQLVAAIQDQFLDRCVKTTKGQSVLESFMQSCLYFWEFPILSPIVLLLLSVVTGW